MDPKEQAKAKAEAQLNENTFLIEKLYREIELLKSAQIKNNLPPNVFSDGEFKGRKLVIKEAQLAKLHEQNTIFVCVLEDKVYSTYQKGGAMYRTLDVLNELTGKGIAKEISQQQILDFYLAKAKINQKEEK